MDAELKSLLGEFNALHGTDLKTAAEMVAYKQDSNKKQQHPAIIEQGYRPGLVEMTQDECKALCNEYGVEYKDGYEQRVINQVISTEDQDRGGDIVRQHGIDYKNYNGNPQVLFGHMQLFSKFETPVGKSVKVYRRTVNGVIRTFSWGLFMDSETDPSGQSDLVFRMSAGGFLPAASIGFIPHKAYNPKDEKERREIGLGKYGVEFLKSELLEWSKVVLPMNQEALQNHFKALGDGIKQLHVEDINLMKTMKVFGNDDNLLNVAEDAIKGNNTTYSTAAAKEKYTCECLDCGHKMQTEEHCDKVKCPKCGGKMRRAERPGPGKGLKIEPIKLSESGGQEGSNMIKCGSCEKEIDFTKACTITLNEKGEADTWECPECSAAIDADGKQVDGITVIDNPDVKDIIADLKAECGCDQVDQGKINEANNAWIEEAVKAEPDLAAYVKPYAGEHSCRMKSPSGFERFARKNCAQKSDGKCIDVIYGIKDGKSTIQALRYKKDIWTEAGAKKHCTGRKGILFEPAKVQDQEEAKSTVINNVSITGADGAIKELTDAIKELNENVKTLKLELPKPDANPATGASGKPEKRDYDLKLSPLKLS